MRSFTLVAALIVLSASITGCATAEKRARQVYRTCIKYHKASACQEERTIWAAELRRERDRTETTKSGG